MLFLAAIPAGEEVVTTSWDGDAEMIYDTGFMHMLMKHPEGGVSLFISVKIYFNSSQIVKFAPQLNLKNLINSGKVFF